MNKEVHCHHNSSFLSGFFLGSLFGALLLFSLSTSEGKKKAKKLLKKGEEFLEELEGKMPNLNDYWEQEKGRKKERFENPSFSQRVKRRFFTKNGRKLA